MRVRTPIVLLALLLGVPASAQHWFDAPLLLVEPGLGECLGVGEYDGDGDADILVLERKPTTWATGFRIALNDGSGRFTDGPTHALPAGFGYQGITQELVDLTGDGFADVLIRRDASLGPALLVHPGGPGGSAGSPHVLAVPTTFEDIALGDMDGDGVDEVAILHPVTTQFLADDLVGWWDWNGSAFVALPGKLLPNATSDAMEIEAVDANADGRANADLDGDGDIDGVGPRRIEARRFDGPEDGTIRQYGAPAAGTGGGIPVLGASGPVRPGSTTAALHLRQGRGGAPAFLLIGSAEANIPGFGVPGFTLYTDPLLTLIPVSLSGMPGGAGQGTFDLPASPLIPIVAGLPIYHQFAILDPAGPSGVAYSNGLEIHYGL